MMKRLLFSAISALFAFSASAVGVGDYVYTPSGRYQLGALKTELTLTDDLEGWESINDEAKLDRFQVVDGFVSAITAANTYGLYKSFILDDNEKTYVLVFDAKANEGTFATTFTPQWLGTAGDHIAHLNVYATEDGEYVNTATEAGTIAKQADLSLGFQLTSEYQTYATAVTNGGSDLTWFIEMSQFLDGISLGNIKIYEATQVYDNRFLQNKIDYLNAIIGVYDWESMDKTAEETKLWNFIKAASEDLAEMSDATSVEDGEKKVTEVNDSIVRFCATFFGDYAADNKIRFQDGAASVGKTTGAVAGWSANNRWWYTKGNSNLYWGNYAYLYACSEVSQQTKTLAAGAYVFAVDAYMDAMAKKGTIINHGYGYYSSDTRTALCRGALTLSILNEAGEPVYTGKTIALDNLTHQTGVVAFNIPEGNDGVYTFKIDANDTYEALNQKVGGNGYMNDLRIFFKAAGKYNAKQLKYIEDVRAQITAMRNAYDASQSYVEDPEGKYYWYKQAVADTADLYINNLEYYEALTDDDIINGFDDPASKAAKEEWTPNIDEEGNDENPDAWDYNLSYAKYAAGTQNGIDTLTNRAVRPLLRLNERFLAYNQTLLDMLEAIDKAKVILNTRVFSERVAYSTLDGAVGDAEAMFEDYKEDPGDVETLVNEMIPAVQDVTNTMNETMTNFYESGYNAGSEPTVLRQFDFEDAAAFTLDVPETEPGAGKYTDATGVMTFGTLELTTNTTQSYQNGYLQDNVWTSQGFLRVGNGDATVALNEGERVSGTDALHVSFDLYFGNLITKSCGVYLRDGEGNNVSGIWGSKYDGSWLTAGYNPFQIDGNNDFTGVGSSTASNLAIVAESNKTHMDFYLDYGEKTMFVIINGARATNKRYDAVMENQNPVASFVVNSNYNNSDRRSWVDNIVIEKIPLPVPAGYYAVKIAEGIENGTVVAVPSTAKAGDEVTIKATPAEGYELASVTVTGVNTNQTVEVVDGKFTMPEDDVTVNAEFQEKQKIEGDVNGDGEVNVGDLVSVSNFMAGEAGDITLEDADVNKDGEVNVGDMVTITNIMAGNE